jgi:alginate O-acetyltransferase complex protein AlgI
LYIPLGGSRSGKGRTYFNLFTVMFLGGLWHGAAWKFALWGALHGFFLVCERLATSRTSKTWHRRPESESRNHSKEPRIIRPEIPGWTFRTAIFVLVKWMLTFHLVTALWLTFMMPDMASIRAFFFAVFSMDFKLYGPPVFAMVFYGIFIVAYHGWGWLREHRPLITGKLSRSPLEAVCHGLMFFLILTNPGAPSGFIYFQF